MQQHGIDPRLAALSGALAARPAVAAVLDGLVDDAGLWSLCLSIDAADPEAWDEVRRFAWLFNNLYGAVPDAVAFRPVVVEEHRSAERHLCWIIESLSPDYTPDRALDQLLTPLPAFQPSLATA